jgi:predicted GIY-YIG superfamily endonuclease
VNKDHLYFIRIGDRAENLYKIGTTNNLKRRMNEHKRIYKKPIEILWTSPPYSKYTTLRVEEKTKQEWKQKEGFHHIPNDRFIIDSSIHQVKIKVRKEWTIDL